MTVFGKQQPGNHQRIRLRVLLLVVTLCLVVSTSSAATESPSCDALRVSSEKITSSRQTIEAKVTKKERFPNNCLDAATGTVRGGASHEEAVPEEEEGGTGDGDVMETPKDTTEEEDSSSSVVKDTDTTTNSAAAIASVESSSETKSVEDEEDTTSEPVTAISTSQDPHEVRELATQLRLQGKEFHDQADFAQAASFFQQAADMLLPVLEASILYDGGGDDDDNDDDSLNNLLLDDFSTCRLHEALCRLKGEEYEKCIAACTDFLEGKIPTSSTARVVRARAFHRRAKAKLGLEDTSGALEDARSAAFLGDRKAVALYGRLMRETSSSSPSLFGSPGSGGIGGGGSDAMSSTLERLLSSSGSSASSSSSPSSSLFESLLSNSGSPGSSLLGDMSPAAMLMGKNPLGFLTGSKGGGPGGGNNNSGLAKSVLKSLAKRLEEDSTQDTICGYLQGTNKAQLTQLAAMAGASEVISEGQIDKVVGFCHGVTPKTIKKTVRTTKGVVYVVQIFRRIGKLLSKYKSLIAAIVLLQWTKSAVLRPMPINKVAAKRALKDAMKANRPNKKKK